jgi:uncharacterized protein (DUF58 family)
MKLEKFRLEFTALWIIFGPVIACMWLAAVNYANNLVYAVLYLIASLAFVSVFHTWRNLAAFKVEHIRIHPAFAGEEVRMEIHLNNPAKFGVYGIHFARQGDEAGLTRRMTPLRLTTRGGARLAAGDSACVEVVFPSALRGVYRFGSLVVRSSYPFGLIWASYLLPVNQEYYVYPAPRGRTEWPALQPSGDASSADSNRPGDDFSGVRAYMPGESLRHVDWKAFARGRPLSVKQFTGGSGHEMWLDAAELGRLPLEARLSQLALWVIHAEKEGIPYALRLGRTMLPLGLGPAQSRRALEALAVAGQGSN